MKVSALDRFKIGVGRSVRTRLGPMRAALAFTEGLEIDPKTGVGSIAPEAYDDTLAVKEVLNPPPIVPSIPLTAPQ